MPFLTEELWHAVYDGNPPAKSVALTRYPTGKAGLDDFSVESMLFVQSVINAVRALRKEAGVEERASVPVEVRTVDVHREVIAANRDIVERLARVSEMRFVEAISANLPKQHNAEFELGVVYEKTIDVPAERERLTKEIAKLEKGLASAESKLGSEAFLSKAPSHIVDGLKKQAAETRALLEKFRRDLDGLGT